MLTPGLILGRFKLANDTPTRPVNLIIGAGYQVAVTPNPVTQNNFVGTIRVAFSQLPSDGPHFSSSSRVPDEEKYFHALWPGSRLAPLLRGQRLTVACTPR